MDRGPYFWTIKNVAFETDDAITIIFDTGGEGFQFLAGQFVNVTLVMGSESISRSYSLTSRPSDDYPTITVKRVPDGIMSNYLIDYWREIGTLKVEGPFGNFVLPTPVPAEAELVFLAGGSGISPIYSLIQEQCRTSRKMFLINANRAARDVIFSAGLSELAAGGNLRTVHALSSDTAQTTGLGGHVIRGRLSRLILRRLLKDTVPGFREAYYFICGPQGLNELYAEALESLGIPESQIITEFFHHQSAGVPAFARPEETLEVLINWQESASMYAEAANDKMVTITTLIPVLPGDTILQAALRQGLPLRVSCSSGTCGTCWARCSAGAVKMIQNYALTEEDVRNNMILLCQAFPEDQHVTIDVMSEAQA